MSWFHMPQFQGWLPQVSEKTGGTFSSRDGIFFREFKFVSEKLGESEGVLPFPVCGNPYVVVHPLCVMPTIFVSPDHARRSLNELT